MSTIFAALFMAAHIAGVMHHLIVYPDAPRKAKLQFALCWEFYAILDFCHPIAVDAIEKIKGR